MLLSIVLVSIKIYSCWNVRIITNLDASKTYSTQNMRSSGPFISLHITLILLHNDLHKSFIVSSIPLFKIRVLPSHSYSMLDCNSGVGTCFTVTSSKENQGGRELDFSIVCVSDPMHSFVFWF